MKDKIKKVNDILLAGEPNNISYDTYSGYMGYKPQYVISAMNEVFGAGEWGFKELSMAVTETLAITQVEVFLNGIEFKPTAWGQSRITKGDDGDARKGAQTDALKKALSYFSIGERAYLGLLPHQEQENAPPSAYKPRSEVSEQNTVKGTQTCVLCGSGQIRISKTSGKPYCFNGYQNGNKVAGHIIKEVKLPAKTADEVVDETAEQVFLNSLSEE